MENNKIIFSNEVVKLPPLKQKVWGADNLIEMERDGRI